MTTNNTTANETKYNNDNAKYGRLMRYADASYVRPATARERRDSICAGDAGVIEVTIGGQRVACYVEE